MTGTLPLIEDFDAKYEAFRNLYEMHLHRKLSHPDLTFSRLDEQLKIVGVFSLATYSDQPLMWSHYGQQHKGVCLGFDVRDLTPSADPELFVQVRYSDPIPRMDENGFIHKINLFMGDHGEIVSEGRIALSDASIRTAISTKATCWRYEAEWRYIESNGDTLYPYPGPLVEIIFGFHCSPKDRARYTELAKTHLTNDVRSTRCAG